MNEVRGTRMNEAEGVILVGKRVTIVGIGRVGGALATKLRSVGVDVRTVRRAEFDTWSASKEDIGEIVAIAVRDQDVRRIAGDIAQADSSRLAGTVVIHVNGSMRLDVLQSCADAGARVGAAHPFQTFANSDADVLEGIAWGVECDDDVWEPLKSFVELSGGVPHRLQIDNDGDKRVYHTAAIAASNYTYAAYELGRRLAEEAGIPVDTFLLPIMERTYHNAAQAIRSGVPFPLTGPIQRGDVAAVSKQLSAIPAEDKQVYIHLSLALLHLNKDNMKAETFKEMSVLLSEAIEAS